MKKLLLFFCLGSLSAIASEFTSPNVNGWILVNTNAVRAWDATQRANPDRRVWPGVMADLKTKEVRLLAEAVGHRIGTIVEFLLIGSASDRAYEAAAVSLAAPGDITHALEAIGIPRGVNAHSGFFLFWPQGERVHATFRLLNSTNTVEQPLEAILHDVLPNRPPLINSSGWIFTGGVWKDNCCQTDRSAPCSILSLYNNDETILDLPAQIGQGAAYGRLVTAIDFPYGALMEVRLTASLPKDNQPRVTPLHLAVHPAGTNLWDVVCTDPAGKVRFAGKLDETLRWLKAGADAERDFYLTLSMDPAMTLAQASQIADIFCVLDGKGIKLNGRPKDGLFPRAFVPEQKWRQREGRSPQPFEIHLTRGTDGKLAKSLTFIDEDWNVEGIDPKLTPKDYPFEKNEDLPALLDRIGNEDSKKVEVLFLFAPRSLDMGTIFSILKPIEKRLPLVYLFAD